MAEQQRADEGTEQPKPGRNRKRLLYALAALLLVVLGALLWRTYSQRIAPVPKSSNAAVIGVVDLQQVMKAHNAYAELSRLYEEQQSLLADLAMERQMSGLQSPKADQKAFEDLAAGKERTAGFLAHTKLMEQLRAAEKTKREETQADYLAAKRELDDAYLNAIFNVRLKLDNADSMHLTADAVSDLEEQLVSLQKERGQRQHELQDQYEGAIHAYAAAVSRELGGSAQADQLQKAEQLRAEEMKKQTEAQKRNTEAMEKAMSNQGQRSQRILEKKAALQSKQREIQTMEDHILKDIAGKASRLAILHHLTLILANPSVNLQAINTGMLHVGPWPEKYKTVVSVDTMDLTQELLEELK